MIDSLYGFKESIKNNKISSKTISETNRIWLKFQEGTDELFCSNCGSVRRCVVSNIVCGSFYIDRQTKELEFKDLPYLFKAVCLQCECESLLLIYEGPENVEMVVLHNTYSGCVTPHTPNEVKYYIDQAFRARSVGAISAAMAMYRSALEWLLHDQGFTSGMLGKKIIDLETGVKGKTAPKWAMEIDPDFLKAIKDIGNGAMHTNGGDVTKQTNLDKELSELVDIVLAELLDKIYEHPLRSAGNLAKLKAKAIGFK